MTNPEIAEELGARDKILTHGINHLKHVHKTAMNVSQMYDVTSRNLSRRFGS